MLYEPHQILKKNLIHHMGLGPILSSISQGETVPHGYELRTLTPIDWQMMGKRSLSPWRGLSMMPVNPGPITPGYVPIRMMDATPAHPDTSRLFSLTFLREFQRNGGRPTPAIRWTWPPLAMNAARISQSDRVVVTPTTYGLYLTRYPTGYKFKMNRHSDQVIPTHYMQTADCATNLPLADQRPERYSWDVPQDGQIRLDINPDRLFLLYGIVLK